MVDERLAFLVSYNLNAIYRPERVILAIDKRASSPKLLTYLANGFSQSTEILFIGEAAIPQFYFAAKTGNFDIGVMITASHLGGSENGFKIVGKMGMPLDEAEMISLKNHCERNAVSAIVTPKHPMQSETKSVAYLEALKKFIRISSQKVIVCCDFNQTSAEVILRKLFEELQIPILAVPPRAKPGNPLLSETRNDLKKLVLENRSELGIIWDSDADRVLFVDATGDLIPPSYILAILGKYLILSDPYKKVAVDVRAGLVVRDVIEEAGGTLSVVPAWHQFIQFAMEKDPEIVFGGETTGHLFFRDFYTIDDGIAAAFKFMEAISLSENRDLLKKLERRYFEIPETNFKCTPEKSILVLQRLTDYYRNKGFLISTIDGLTVFGPNWKFNLRQSATEQLLRLNLEASSAESASLIYEQINQMV